MNYNKEKLLTLRENINKYLRKVESEEKDRYKQIVLSFEDSKVSIDQILGQLKNDKSTEKITILLKEMRDEFGQLVLASKPDVQPIVKSIAELTKLLSEKRDFNDQGIVMNLNRIEKLLSEKPKKHEDRTDEIVKAIKEIKTEPKDIEFPKSISIDNWPPTKTPQPVTNININPLRGLIHTTVATVNTTLTPLPTYGVLNNRRSIMIFNNDALSTVYIGGSDVTTSNGLPVLAQSYSPSIDAGERMVLYGIASSSVNVRVIEISNDNIGG